MSAIPLKAFILAAGKGTRLRPYTDSVPKPMVQIAGKSIIFRALDKLKEAGVKDVIVNLHHLAPVLETHLKTYQGLNIFLSHEQELLETGGGLRKALPIIGTEAFYIINGDALWSEGTGPTVLQRLADEWNPGTMDILLLLQPTDRMSLTGGVGDYNLAPDGKAIRAHDKQGTHMFAGVRIAHPDIFDGTPEGAFSFLNLMDKAEKAGRLYGLVHDGEWYHISTPEDLEAVDQAYRAMEKE